MSAASTMSVERVPFHNLRRLVTCDYRNDGRPGSLDPAIPAVQITSAPIGSSAWRAVSIDRAIASGRLRRFEDVNTRVVRGGQYVDTNVAVLWIDDPPSQVRYQVWINYGSTEARPAEHVAQMNLEAVGELVTAPLD